MSRPMSMLAILVLSGAAAVGIAPAVAAPQSGIQVVRAWARAPAGGGAAAMYLTLRDAGAEDRLTSVSTDASQMAMLHESVTLNGVDEMRDLSSAVIPAGGTLAMRPGGMHVMLMDMNRRLQAGDTIHAILTFAHAPPLTVAVPVLAAGAPAPQ